MAQDPPGSLALRTTKGVLRAVAIPVIDVFAGPGGLNEGFSSALDRYGRPKFETVASFEMDASACETLRLRATHRRLRGSSAGMNTYLALVRGELSLEQAKESPEFKHAWRASEKEVHKIELGPDTRSETDRAIGIALGSAKKDGPWILVGGPPCQAYSLAGRSRRTHDVAFEADKKHFLYKEYLSILEVHMPPVFVMENVKGLLSSTHSGSGMFHKILEDLRSPAKGPGYAIHSLTVADAPEFLSPKDFVIRAEDYGVPQRRHRIILVGIRNDLRVGLFPRLTMQPIVSVQDVLAALPKLRSGISKRPDQLDDWLAIRERAQQIAIRTQNGRPPTRLSRGSHWVSMSSALPLTTSLDNWLVDPTLDGVAQHMTRSHMAEDLMRYWFAANFALREGVSPKLGDFPRRLLPKHANATAAVRPFDDRFRVQLWDRPSTTVVSHIAKDGHYYIHPDPDQMRSLTVREVARLQTFPDNYLFLGNRTHQFTQVGNAVPPFLAKSIADVIAQVFDRI